MMRMQGMGKENRAHARWTLLNGKKDNEVGAQTRSVGASMCRIDISAGHMCIVQVYRGSGYNQM